MLTLLMLLGLSSTPNCDEAISWLSPPAQTAGRYVTCLHVERAAELQGFDPQIAVAVGWKESRFNPNLVSKAGARGPIQVIAKWWCPGRKLKGCDLVHHGVRALRELTAKYGLDMGLQKYNGGNNPGEKAVKYSKRVREKLRLLRRKIKT